jgi:hypothetical protein
MTDTDSDSEYEGQIIVILDRNDSGQVPLTTRPASQMYNFANLHYTKPCQNAERGFQCPRSLCTFAHTITQLRILPCRDGDKCRYKNTTCRFIHGHETKGSYFHRTGYTPKLPEA